MAHAAPLLQPESPQTARAADGLLQLRGIDKHWGKRPVLSGLELAVAPGSVVSITGGNGTGKTTLLRVAAGLVQPDAGTVSVSGLDPVRDRRRYMERLGFLSAGDRGLYARLSARRHLHFAARLALVASGRRNAHVEQALQTFELAEFADRRVDRLSTGQRQRVRLAMSLVHHPDVILLDEPMNSLDSEGLGVLSRALGLARNRGAAVVWCAPEGDGTNLVADTRLRLAEGRLCPA